MDAANRDALCAFLARKISFVLDDSARVSSCEYQDSSDRFICHLKVKERVSLNCLEEELQKSRYNFRNIVTFALPNDNGMQLQFQGGLSYYKKNVQRVLAPSYRDPLVIFLLLSLLMLLLVIYVVI